MSGKTLVRSRNLGSVFDGYQSLVFGSFFGFVFFFSFCLVFKESNFSEFMDSAYRTELVDFKESQHYKAVYWWASACFHWSFRSFYLALSYLYHYFEMFGA